MVYASQAQSNCSHSSMFVSLTASPTVRGVWRRLPGDHRRSGGHQRRRWFDHQQCWHPCERDRGGHRQLCVLAGHPERQDEPAGHLDQQAAGRRAHRDRPTAARSTTPCRRERCSRSPSPRRATSPTTARSTRRCMGRSWSRSDFGLVGGSENGEVVQRQALHRSPHDRLGAPGWPRLGAWPRAGQSHPAVVGPLDGEFTPRTRPMSDAHSPGSCRVSAR
jgi:hypothetical protein